MSESVQKDGLWYRCVEFVTEQSAGEWDDKTIADDGKLMNFVHGETGDRPALLHRIEELEAALREISDRNIGDQPASSAGDDLSWVQRQYAELRRIARAALSNSGESR